MNYVSSKLAELQYTINFSKYLSISLLSVDFGTMLVYRIFVDLIGTGIPEE